MNFSRPSTGLISVLFATAALAQQGTQTPLTLPPGPPVSPAARELGQPAPLPQQPPNTTHEAPLPQPDKTTVDLRDLAPLSAQPATPAQASPSIQNAADRAIHPAAEAPSPFNTHSYSVIGPYRASRTPELPHRSLARLDMLVRDGKLFLSLHDAIALAIENNLDVEVSRYDPLLADTDLTRAQGGGTLRGLDFTIQQTAPGVGEITSPLLVTASTGTPASTNAAVTDLSQVTQTGSGIQQNLSENSTSAFSTGPSLPLFDPTVIAEAGYLRRSNQTSLINTTTGGATTGGGTASATTPLDYVSTGVDYQQGFSSGAQIDAYISNAAQVLYAGNSQYNPFHAPSASFTLSQPLLRSRGRGINLRFIRIAKLDQKVSRLLFAQQLLETIYGVSRLYYDLVSLGENIGVQEESLAAAQRLFDDDKSQVDEGTLAPIELIRAQALLSSSRLSLIQARGEYRQQEVILKEQLLRNLGDPGIHFASIVAIDPILVPDLLAPLDVPALIADALGNRPDLAQAALQVKADEIAAEGSRNGVKPLLNVYANVQSRGASLVPYQTLGSLGTGTVTAPVELTQGGLRLSTIYQGGVQLNLPLRNRIAQSDYARDALQLRQAQSRTAKLENDIRQQIENAAIALETAHQAYDAAVQSRNYQQQLLQAEQDKFAVGASTNFLIVQDEAFLAQARSTEVAARSDWMKSRISLDRALGNLLEKNNVVLDDAALGNLH